MLPLLCLALALSDTLFLERGIHYLSFNASGPRSVFLTTPPTARTTMVVVQSIGEFVLGYFFNDTSKYLPFPNPHGATIGANTRISISLGRSSFLKLAYVTLQKTQCNSFLAVTNRSYLHTFYFSGGETNESCMLYAPAAPYAQFNVQMANMDNRFDSLTVFHTIVNDVWYDRYESIDEPSGWSPDSDRPWFFRVSIWRPSGPGSAVDVTVALRADPDAQIEGETGLALVNPEALPDVQLAGGGHNVAVPIIGCLAPTLLLAAWIYGACTVARKAVLQPAIEPADF
jgi:hypothetical protein